MSKVSEVCRHVRSKNAGPFWITVDLFFRDQEMFEKYAGSAELQVPAIAALFDAEEVLIKRFPLPSLLALKISYPRKRPQGGALERDMHGGQQYLRLLDVELSSMLA
jgi:hypothetical protein